MKPTTSKSGEVFALNPKHDARHQLGNVAHARESLVFMLQLPEDNVAAFIYTWVSGDGKAGAALSVYGKSVGSEPIFEACDGIPVAAEMTFDDWRVGDVHVHHGKPLEIADVTYAGKAASIDYHFEAMHPAYNYGSSPEGCPPWMAADRFEQSGRVRGTLRIGERVIPFDTFGHRDHSWGTRDWGQVQQSKWLEAQTGPDVALNVFQYAAVNRTGFMGYVQKEGRIAEVTGVHFEFNLDESFYHASIDVVIEDAAGRKTTVRGTTFALFEFKVSPLYTLNEGSLAVEIDGKKGVGHLEMGWPKAYLDYLRQQNS
jgi:hypothetical protein